MQTIPCRVSQHPLLSMLVCPVTQQPLLCVGDELVTPDEKHRYPIENGIPRFVESDLYVGSFSFEWNMHKRTQLDTHRQDQSSEAMFQEKTGLTRAQVEGKLILDAGVGAGRFTDILLKWGARVVGIDLSYAVEAAHENFGHRSDALICQADIGNLPFRPGTFDFIISIGVLHHTPDTAKYFSCLPRYLKPGGEIAVWVYPDLEWYLMRRAWIPFTSRIPCKMLYGFCKVFVPWAVKQPRNRLSRWLHKVFPISDQRLGVENDILDTFDGCSPRYHGVHSTDEVVGWFRNAGLVDIKPQATLTSVRGRRPAPLAA